MTSTDTTADYVVSNHGTIFLLTPLSDAAREQFVDHVDDAAPWFGGSLCVEHRYIADVVDQLQADGWVVR